MVNNDIAMRFLQAVSYSSSKEQLLDSEILILKTLNFNLNVPNPVTYVETLLEVLGKTISRVFLSYSSYKFNSNGLKHCVLCFHTGHNEATVPVAELHHLCVHVLQFIYLQRETIYNSLLISATGCPNPSEEQRYRLSPVFSAIFFSPLTLSILKGYS